jgi:hypothetical protein
MLDKLPRPPGLFSPDTFSPSKISNYISASRFPTFPARTKTTILSHKTTPENQLFERSRNCLGDMTFEGFRE